MDESVRLEIPGLGARHSELRAWAVSSTLTSLGRHNMTLPGDELTELLYRACMAAARTPVVSALEPVATMPNRGRCAVLPTRDAARHRGTPFPRAGVILRSAPAKSARARESRAPACTARSLPSRPFSMRSSVGSTNGASSNAPARCARMAPKTRTSSQARRRATSSSASTTRTSSPCRSPNCRTRPARSATAISGIRPTARPSGSTWSASWFLPTTVAEARLLVAAAVSFIEDVARTWHLTRYARDRR